MNLRCLAALAVGAVVGGPLSAQSPYVGNWKINLAKSKYTNVDPPKSSVRTYTNLKDGFSRGHAVSVDSKGTTVKVSHTLKRDEKDYPVTGSQRWDTISVHNPTDFSDEWRLKLKGKEVGRGTTVMSKDKKTLTITWEGKNEKGEPASSVAVFDRQ
jgi:hypothetical protein